MCVVFDFQKVLPIPKAEISQMYYQPVERIMSILNLAFQNVSTERDHAGDAAEGILKSYNMMEDIRKKKNLVERAWKESLKAMIDKLQECIERCSLKDISFITRPTCTAEEVDGVLEDVAIIDPVLQIGQFQKKQLDNARKYHQFKENHCREQHHSFQVGVFCMKLCNRL